MRIIGGALKGRRFTPPAKNWPTRPTTDYAKEGMYNVLQNLISFDEIIFLDLFGGTGNHCYEMYSRGCRNMTYVDRHRPCIRFVQETAQQFGMEEYIDIILSDVFKYLKRNRKSYDLVFAGPPYPLKDIPLLPALILPHLSENGLLILEHNPNHNFEQEGGFWRMKNYGTTIFSFFKTGIMH